MAGDTEPAPDTAPEPAPDAEPGPVAGPARVARVGPEANPAAAALHPNTRAVLDAADHLGLSIDVVSYPNGTRTATDAAEAIGCDVGQIVKSLVFIVDGTVTLALMSGANQLDEQKLCAAADADHARRAHADEVRAATGFPIGGVAPFGHTAQLPIFVDPDLLRFDVVWAAAGTPTTVFGVEPGALVEATGAVLAELRRR